MLSLTDARALISSLTPALQALPTELRKALGHRLVHAAIATEPIPSFDRSAMDGYAVNDTGSPGQFQIVGEIQTGTPSDLFLAPGECARIFTGGPTPKGTTRVVLQEHTRLETPLLFITTIDKKSWIRRRGEDALAGTTLLPAGTRLGPGELSLLAGVGITTPVIACQPRIIHFTTGNEIVPPQSTPKPGQIRDSNSTLVAALLHGSGARLMHQEHVQDTLESLVRPISALEADHWDMLLISGGASVGDFDFGAKALEALGFSIHFRKLNLRPGKPLIFATRGSQIAFVIPGNPVSHFVTYHVAIDFALSCLTGSSREPTLVRILLAADLLSKADPRETWWPACVAPVDGRLRAHPIAWQSSGDLRGLANANALLRLTPDTTAISANTEVECLLLEMHLPPIHP